MELRHLRYFVAVAEEENVTRAAARLHVSQPPLSRQIRDLEEELGLQLFERKPQSLPLTAAGQIFLGEARAVLERVDEALRVAASLSEQGRQELNIGYAPSLTVEILPQALRRFQSVNGKVRVRLHDLSTGEMLQGLREGRLDVALMIEPEARELKGIQFTALRKHEVCVAMHPAHPMAKARKVGLGEVAAERLITYNREEYPEYHAWLGKLFRRQRPGPLIGEEHDSATSLIASVEAGRGVALVQQGFESLAGSRLVVRPLKPAPPPFVVGVACRKGPVDAAVSDFLAAVIEKKPA